MKKIILIIIMAILIPTIMGATVKIYPSADAYTTSGSEANTNLNNFNLRVGNDENHGKHRSYLKFDLSPLSSNTITGAAFNIDPQISIGGGVTAELHYVSSDSWSENSINWNNAPSFSSTITDSQTINGGERIEFDINSLINEQDGVLSFALTSSQESTVGRYVQFFSNNNLDESYKPYIEVTIDGEDPTCNTDADTDCDGCVEMPELLSFINEWKQGNVQMSGLLNSISKWKLGEGC